MLIITRVREELLTFRSGSRHLLMLDWSKLFCKVWNKPRLSTISNMAAPQSTLMRSTLLSSGQKLKDLKIFGRGEDFRTAILTPIPAPGRPRTSSLLYRRPTPTSAEDR